MSEGGWNGGVLPADEDVGVEAVLTNYCINQF